MCLIRDNNNIELFIVLDNVTGLWKTLNNWGSSTGAIIEAFGGTIDVADYTYEDVDSFTFGNYVVSDGYIHPEIPDFP